MLPFDVRDFKQPSSKGSQLMEGKFPDYMRRLCDFRQMDFEAAFDQLLTLVSLEPNQIYTSFYYRKQTKNQWARDDPAFVVIQAAFVAVGSLAFAIAFRHPSFWGYLWSIIYSLLFDWLLVGFTVTSVCSHLANKYMRQYHSHSVEQDVEWLYAFDVHANSFFCSFLLTYVVQYFLLPILMSRSVFSCILSNTLYGLATIWYAYITHLGYRALPFLGNTQVFLWYPAVAVATAWLFSVFMILLGLRINMTRIIMAFHYG
mmetsp:Transcript_578/g.1009  ORF Transcript_578/g.1009 Transcript_578/m.1009 type:complete len:259 (-) Transcript_578:2073-2849(-)